MMNKEPQKPSNQAPVINLSGVCKSFGSRTVLETISFSVTGREGLCICGANAAGKTTLLRIIAGLLQPGEGMVEVCGFNMATDSQRIKPMLGVIFHKSMVYPQLTVIENLQFFARLYGAKNNKMRIQELLEQTGLTPYRYDSAGILSGGMTQRLAIARALIHKPVVLLADEPFAGLDDQARKYLIKLMSSFKNDGGTVVMTTHDINLALDCCDKIAVLDDRKLIFSAKISDINTAGFTMDYLSYARKNSNVFFHCAIPASAASQADDTDVSYLRSFGNVIKAIFIKDIVSEFRTKQTLPAMILLGVVIVWVFRIATEAATGDKPVPAAAVIVAILFSAILASERGFAVEQQNNCISALMLAPVDAGDIYISKLLVNITMLSAFELVAVPAVLLLFNVNASGNWLQLAVVLLLTNIGISSIGTLLGCAVQGTRTRNSVLSILMAAVLCPLMIPAIFALLLLFGSAGSKAIIGGTLGMVGNFKTALGFMAAFDAIFVTVCWLLFGFVVSEQEE